MSIDPIAILRHGIRSVLRNAGTTLALCWPWLIVIAIVFAVLFYIVMQSGFGTTPLEPGRGAGTFTIAMLIGMAVYATAFSSIAVNWHRYILRDEFPSVADRLRVDGAVWRYFWRAVVSALLVFAILIVPLILLTMLAPAFFVASTDPDAAAVTLTAGHRIAFLAVAFVLGSIGTALFFRFALALPAVAVGRSEIGVFDSWRRTSGLFGPLLVIAAGTVALQIAAQLADEGLGLIAGNTQSIFGLVLSVAVSAVVAWFFTFLGITLLTSLYGHIVENRPL